MRLSEFVFFLALLRFSFSLPFLLGLERELLEIRYY